MTTLAIPRPVTALNPFARLSKLLSDTRARRHALEVQVRLQRWPDYLLDDIGVSREEVPRLTCGQQLPNEVAVARALRGLTDTSALDRTNFHSGK